MTDELISKTDVVKIVKSVLSPASSLVNVARARRQMLNEINELSTNLASLGTDCISRQAAIDAVEESRRLNHHEDGKEACAHEYEHRHFLKILRDLPTAEPKRIRGKWVHHPEIGWGETWLCDQCGEKTTSTVMGKPRANFCPNCGAKMEVNHESN